MEERGVWMGIEGNEGLVSRNLILSGRTFSPSGYYSRRPKVY